MVSFIAMFTIAGLLSVWIFRESRMSERLQRLVWELAKSRDELEANKGLMTQFVMNMSHRIRTPLNSISGYTDLLTMSDSGFSEEERNEFCSYIQTSTSLLVMLYDDILCLLDMENGHFLPVMAPCKLYHNIREVVNSFQSMLSAGVELAFDNRLPKDIEVSTDGRRIQLLLLNGLAYASERTLSGTITLSTYLKPEDNQTLVISITDAGQNLSKEKVKAISSFLDSKHGARLKRIDKDSVLELSICRMISSHLGGRAHIDKDYPGSTNDHGARFFFEIPIA